MKVVIAGGSGQVGMILSRAFLAGGHAVTLLSRRPGAGPYPVVRWDAETLGPWAATLEGADAVINLAGRSVNCRYHAKNRRAIMRSRVQSVRILGQAIGSLHRPPRVWLQASTATIYAHRYDAPNDEATGILGGSEPGATGHVAIQHRRGRRLGKGRALEADVPRTRKVLLRSAMTMSPDRGGIFDTLLTLVRRGLGGASGDGRQYVSWISDQDFIRAVCWLIERDSLQGPVNVAAPHPLPNAQFMQALRAAWGIRFGLPAARWMLEIGAVAMRTETELILKSRRVVPGRLLESGFNFQFPTWPEAAADLCRRWRGRRSRYRTIVNEDFPCP